jgi:cytochrome c oxidase subunit 2
MGDFLSLWPDHASAYAAEVDTLIAAFTVLIVALSAPVFILIVVFAIKYRRGRPANRQHAANRNIWLEVSWSVIPFILLLFFYVWSTRLFLQLRHPPLGALEIDVVAKQWMWKFQHPGGQSEINDLHVPVGEPILFRMASQDVIHSLYIPALRIKQDVVPGRYTELWFTAMKTGSYRLTCTQFCGVDHALMGGELVIMSQAAYAQWLQQSNVDQSLAAQGKTLFRTDGCGGCHSASATTRAPELGGLYGHAVALNTGATIVADEQYIRDSILLPHQQIVAGYADIMPSYQTALNEGDVLKLVAYIKSLQPADPEMLK